MRKEEIVIDGTKFILKTHVENRNNLRASLRGRNINIRIPRFIPKKERERYISETINKLSKAIRLNPEIKPKPVKHKTYRDGDALSIGNEIYVINIKEKDQKTASAKISGNAIAIIMPTHMDAEERNECAPALISRVLAKQKQAEIEKRVMELNEAYFKKSVKSVRLKNTRTRWGSCSSRGNINLSTRLLLAPDDVMDYVIIHELAHLVEPNHSPKFWSLVGSVVPDYKKKKKWLKDNSAKLRF